VVGENGAGKSTLMKIAYGQVRADAGALRIKGKDVSLASHSPRGAIRRGVGMVHQHFMLVPPLSVVENVVLGQEPVRSGILDLKAARASLVELSERYGLAVDPDAIVEDLSVGQQQRVEILKVLWQGCDILILDEPTAVLTPGEVAQLFAALREWVARGMTIVIITHKLDEVVAIADQITVMRAGEVTQEMAGEGASVESIAHAMVGRSVLLEVERAPASPGDVCLEVRDLCARHERGHEALVNVSLEVSSGEIVGIAGVEGNGQSELQECLMGLRAPRSGTIQLGGQSIDSLSVAQRYAAGVAHVPEDRHARAVVLDFSLQENIALGRQRELSRRGLLDLERCRRAAEAGIAAFDVRPADRDLPVSAFSGGNQQKIVLARELGRPANRLLVCAQPTRGVDIGAIEIIHRHIIEARDAGLAVLLFSAELSELQSLSDRLLVMYGGEIVLRLDEEALRREGARDRIGLAMTGGADGE
jgi:simple sugar transport system ATP-binding protein